MPTPGLDRIIQIYTQPAREPSATPAISVSDWEERARAVLPDGPFGYVAGGAGAEDTMRANREAFYRYRIRPRMLRDVSDRDLSVTLFDTTLPAPFLLAPVGVLSIVHQDAERAPALAAAAGGIPFILSTVSSLSIEEIAAVMGDAPRWFQLYPARDPEIMKSMVRRAEAAGYSAIVVTVDTGMLGWRERDLREAYLPFLQGHGMANYLSDPVFCAGLPAPPQENMQAAIMRFLEVFVNPGFTWDHLDLVAEQTSLPVLVKGITHPADAELALRHDVDGLIVSNHGGRQVDGAVAALDALPLICEAVRGQLPVLMDSGIRHGADALKAVALGATAVLLGRPYVYALAAAGEIGVREVIANLIAEIDLVMALSGYRSPRELDGRYLLPN
jgi:lactate 2-monooxygenase